MDGIKQKNPPKNAQYQNIIKLLKSWLIDTASSHSFDELLRNNCLVFHMMAPTNNAMNNPHEEVQLALVTRIVDKMKLLNESVHEMNSALNVINNRNKDVEALERMWRNYLKSTEYHLETTGQSREPI